MKQFSLFLVLCAALLSCSSSDDQGKTQNLTIVKKYLEAVQTNNISLMDSLLADNYMGYGPSVGDSINKKDALANWKYNMENLYESITYTRHQNIAVRVTSADEADPGDWVSNWALISIKYRNGKGTAQAWVNAVYKIENGRIVRSRTFYNEMDILHQLGFTSVAPAKDTASGGK